MAAFRLGEAMRLLLVEDDPMVGEAVRKGLKLDGLAVDWVRDGAQAEAALADHDYDLLLLDLGLPRKDGLACSASDAASQTASRGRAGGGSAAGCGGLTMARFSARTTTWAVARAVIGLPW